MLRIFVVCMDTASVAVLLMLVCVFSLCWVLVMVEVVVVVVVLMVVVVFLLTTWTAVLVVVLWWLLMLCLLPLVHMLVLSALLAFLQVSVMVHCWCCTHWCCGRLSRSRVPMCADSGSCRAG